MSPVLIWPDQVLGPSHCFYKNCLTNLSKLPQPITWTWEFQFPIPPWILEVFGLVPGIFLEVEIFISRDQPEREENSFAISIWLNWVVNLTGGDQPHFIESSTLNFKFTWPNPHHILHEEYQAKLRTTSVSEGSDTFANTDWSPGPSSLAPHWLTLTSPTSLQICWRGTTEWHYWLHYWSGDMHSEQKNWERMIYCWKIVPSPQSSPKELRHWPRPICI